MKSLGVLETLADEYWEENRPIWYKRLKRTGKLKEELERAARMTQQALDTTISRKLEQEPGPSDAEGAKRHLEMVSREAWEAVREMYIFLPAEEDMEDLKKDLKDAEMEVRWRKELADEWTAKWKAFKKEDYDTEQDYLDTVALEQESVRELQQELDEEWLPRLAEMKKKLARSKMGAL